MGLFGFVKKAVGFAAKTALSKVTGGISDKVFTALKATKAMKTMSVKSPAIKTTAQQVNDLKYSTAKLPKAKKVASEIAAASRRFLEQPAARRARAPARAPRAPKPKAACKYGERVNGRCPPKPKAAPRGGSAAGGRIAAAFVPRITAARAKKAAAAVKRNLPLAGVAAAGAAAFAATRASRFGGAAGDAVVSGIYARKAKKDQNRLNAFRAQLKAERAAGKVSSARVKEIAKAHGL